MRLCKEPTARCMKLVPMLSDVAKGKDIFILKFQTPRRHKSRYQATCFLAYVMMVCQARTCTSDFSWRVILRTHRIPQFYFSTKDPWILDTELLFPAFIDVVRGSQIRCGSMLLFLYSVLTSNWIHKSKRIYYVDVKQETILYLQYVQRKNNKKTVPVTCREGP
jgi:hypothetical protein